MSVVHYQTQERSNEYESKQLRLGEHKKQRSDPTISSKMTFESNEMISIPTKAYQGQTGHSNPNPEIIGLPASTGLTSEDIQATTGTDEKKIREEKPVTLGNVLSRCIAFLVVIGCCIGLFFLLRLLVKKFFPQEYYSIGD